MRCPLFYFLSLIFARHLIEEPQDELVLFLGQGAVGFAAVAAKECHGVLGRASGGGLVFAEKVVDGDIEKGRYGG